MDKKTFHMENFKALDEAQLDTISGAGGNFWERMNHLMGDTIRYLNPRLY